MARQNPDVEIVVRRLKRGKAAVLRGHYGECFIISKAFLMRMCLLTEYK